MVCADRNETVNDGTTNSASNKEAPPNGTGDLRRLSAISANQLNRLAEDSERRKYNRLLIENFKAEGTGWGIMPTFAHQHVKDEQSETHIRCVITKVDEIIAFLDVSLPCDGKIQESRLRPEFFARRDCRCGTISADP